MAPTIGIADTGTTCRTHHDGHRDVPDLDVRAVSSGGDLLAASGGPLVAFASTATPAGPPGRVAGLDPVRVAAVLANLTFTAIALTSAHAAGESLWAAVTDAAVTLVPGAEQAGITTVVGVHSRAAAASSAAASGLVQLLMKAQDATGEGPCLDAARSGEQVQVRDLHTETRWPGFAARAPWQLHSLVCTPIAVRGATVSVLAVVSARSWAFDDNAAQLATVVAAHAGLALTIAQHTRNLHAEADGRDVIGQAKGILMQRHHLTAEQAFRALAQASQNSDIQLHTLCQQLADTGKIPGRHQWNR